MAETSSPISFYDGMLSHQENKISEQFGNLGENGEIKFH